MNVNKSLLSGSTTMLILKLLESKDMYGYEMIEQLSNMSDHTFALKAGTLYPILHNLEKNEYVESYEDKANAVRIRKYYHLTIKGKKTLNKKQQEWLIFTKAVDMVLKEELILCNQLN